MLLTLMGNNWMFGTAPSTAGYNAGRLNYYASHSRHIRFRGSFFTRLSWKS